MTDLGDLIFFLALRLHETSLICYYLNKSMHLRFSKGLTCFTASPLYSGWHFSQTMTIWSCSYRSNFIPQFGRWPSVSHFHPHEHCLCYSSYLLVHARPSGTSFYCSQAYSVIYTWFHWSWSSTICHLWSRSYCLHWCWPSRLSFHLPIHILLLCVPWSQPNLLVLQTSRDGFVLLHRGRVRG